MWSDRQAIPHERFVGSSRDEYRPDIDGLRCIAVMLVLLFHFDLPEGFRSGFIGVDVFFVISGFLIVPPIVAQVQARTFSFRRFYERRIRRLAPALLATTLLTFGVALFALTPIEMISFAGEAIAAQLYVSNVYYWRYLNYFGLLANQSYLLHTWSLGVEEQFYLTFPLLLWFAAKLLPHRILLILGLVGVSSFALNVVCVGWKPEATFYLLPTRAWEFAAGAFVPQVIKLTARVRLPTGSLVAGGIAVLLTALVTYRPTTPFPGWYALLPVLSTVLLLAAGTNRETPYHRIISSPIPRYLGRISYELYLVHWPIKILIPLFIAELGYAVRLGELLLSLLLAAAIYHLVEAPIRGRRVLRSAKPLVIAYTASTTAVVLVLAGAVLSGGIPYRFDERIIAFAQGADDVDERYRSCESNLQRPCVIGRQGVEPTWFIYGDSHADALAGAFNRYFNKHGVAAYFSFQSACMPIANTDYEQCRSYNAAAEKFVANQPHIKNIIMVSTWSISNGFVGDGNRFVKGDAAIASFNRSLDHTLKAFEGRSVAVWLPVPGAHQPVPGTLARNAMWNRDWDVRFSRTEYAQSSDYLRRALSRHPTVKTIDPGLYLCRTGTCDVTFNGRPLYHDNAHPAASQSDLYEQIIAEALDGFEATARPRS